MKKDLYLYNTLGRKKEKFVPIEEGKVGMYVCGPTVDGPGHIGHAVTYIAFDVIRRAFEYLGYDVKYIMNLTDIHDGVINRAKESGKEYFDFANEYCDIHMRDFRRLKLLPADRYVKVTDHIKEIIDLILALHDKGYAYIADDGVYFDVSKFEEYGKLSGIKFDEGLTGQRVNVDKFEKESAVDFALWKFKKEGEPFWDSPWGEGRPGWHVECSAMSTKYLGQPFDIHGGALDLRFPHHENEIAQSECAHSLEMAHYWMHAGLLKINGRKMSKSLNNIITIPDILSRYNIDAFRYWRITSHYRSPIDFSEDQFRETSKAFEKLKLLVVRLKKTSVDSSLQKVNPVYKDRFIDALANDFNTPKALSVIWELVKDKLLKDEEVLGTLLDFDFVLGLGLDEDCNLLQSVVDEGEIQKMIKERNEAKSAKNYTLSDKIRDDLLQQGVILEDTAEGTVWKVK